MINHWEIKHVFHSVPWKDGDYYKLNTDQVEQVLAAADSTGYRKPKNANGSRARYFFYAVQRKLAKEYSNRNM